MYRQQIIVFKKCLVEEKKVRNHHKFINYILWIILNFLGKRLKNRKLRRNKMENLRKKRKINYLKGGLEEIGILIIKDT
jgi:hypothetical protein